MPWMQLLTNIPKSKIAMELPGKIATILSRNLEKPMERIRVHIVPEQIMSFSGSAAPCAVMSVYSIGKITQEHNEKNTKEIMTLLNKDLGIDVARQTIYFSDLKAENVGLNGKTLASP